MATVKIVRTTRKRTEVNIRFRLSDGRGVQIFHSSGIMVNPELWDAKNETKTGRVLGNQYVGTTSLRGLANVANKYLGPAGLMFSVYNVGSSFESGGSSVAIYQAASEAGGWARAIAGGKIGAAVGTSFGPAGTLIGGAIGALILSRKDMVLPVYLSIQSQLLPYFSFSLSCDFNKVTLLETSILLAFCVPVHLQIVIRLSACTFHLTDKILFESAKGLT